MNILTFFLQKSREIGRFFREFAPENPVKFCLFFREISEALSLWCIIREFKIPQWQGRQKHHFKSESASFQSVCSNIIILTCFLCQMQGNSFWVKFLRTISKFKKEKKISLLLTSAHPPKKGETRQFHLVHVVTQYKKVFCICEVVVLLIKHIALWIFSLLLPL